MAHDTINPTSGLDSSLAEFFIEFKGSRDQDPFIADKPSSTEDPLVLVPQTPTSLVAGQITAYATLIMGAQYRTHTFLVLVVRDFARLLRWDRGGAVFTERIYYDEQPHLLDFLVRYNYADRKARGHDVTVRTATAEEQQQARTTVDELKPVERLLTVTIQDPADPQPRLYVICAPSARPQIPVGRWTRTSIAFDCQNKERVFLKDSWRVLAGDIVPEGKIYTRLWVNLVPNIPRCLDSGDVGDKTYHTTRTHSFVADDLPIKITPHRHYRLVLDTVGRKLTCFKSSKEMVHAIHASLIGKDIFCWRSITVFSPTLQLTKPLAELVFFIET
jgi:hypothetical protein